MSVAALVRTYVLADGESAQQTVVVVVRLFVGMSTPRCHGWFMAIVLPPRLWMVDHGPGLRGRVAAVRASSSCARACAAASVLRQAYSCTTPCQWCSGALCSAHNLKFEPSTYVEC